MAAATPPLSEEDHRRIDSLQEVYNKQYRPVTQKLFGLVPVGDMTQASHSLHVSTLAMNGNEELQEIMEDLDAAADCFIRRFKDLYRHNKSLEYFKDPGLARLQNVFTRVFPYQVCKYYLCINPGNVPSSWVECFKNYCHTSSTGSVFEEIIFPLYQWGEIEPFAVKDLQELMGYYQESLKKEEEK